MKEIPATQIDGTGVFFMFIEGTDDDIFGGHNIKKNWCEA